MSKKWMVGAGVLSVVALASCGREGNAENPVSFADDVKPILESRCLGCHQSNALLGRFNLESKEVAFADSDGRVFIDPGNPQGSQVYLALTLPRDDAAAMPPEGHIVPEGEVETIRQWIKQGAPWPDGEAGRLVGVIPQ